MASDSPDGEERPHKIPKTEPAESPAPINTPKQPLSVSSNPQPWSFSSSKPSIPWFAPETPSPGPFGSASPTPLPDTLPTSSTKPLTPSAAVSGPATSAEPPVTVPPSSKKPAVPSTRSFGSTAPTNSSFVGTFGSAAPANSPFTFPAPPVKPVTPSTGTSGPAVSAKAPATVPASSTKPAVPSTGSSRPTAPIKETPQAGAVPAREPTFSAAPTKSSFDPFPGNTYIIKHRTSGKVISMLNGTVHMQRGDLYLQDSCLWECFENSGWTQFRNCVSGTYLGWAETNKRHTVPSCDSTGNNGFLIVRAHRQGDHQFLVNKNGFLFKYQVSKKGALMCEANGDGGVWRFIPV